MILGGLDVGTTGCKIVLYDETCTLQKTYYQEYPTLRQNGRHEISFEAVKAGILELLRCAAKEYPLTWLGVTSFGETFAMVDEQGGILAPSMLYTDPRGEEECAWLKETLGAEFVTLRTGVKPHPMYSFAKILWQKNHNPEVYAKCRHILLGQDYVVYLLTGQTQIDYSLAARTGAFDVETKSWIPEIFSAAGIDPTLLSTPVPSGTAAGKLTQEMKQQLGIVQDITIVSGCHDQVAAMIGSGIFAPDQAMDGSGTVECVPVVLKEKPTALEFYQNGYSVVPYPTGEYACYAFSFTGGASLKWFRDNFAELDRQRAEEAGENVYANLDAKIPEEPTGLLVVPYFAGAATPYMDNDATAMIVGLTLGTDKYTLYKALMEGTSYEMMLNFRLLQSVTGQINEVRATGGGATSDVWLQIKSDMLGTKLTALSCKEVGAAGTTALAGVSAGVYSDWKSAVAKMAPVRKIFTPDPVKTARYAELYPKYAKLYPATRDL